MSNSLAVLQKNYGGKTVLALHSRSTVDEVWDFASAMEEIQPFGQWIAGTTAYEFLTKLVKFHDKRIFLDTSIEPTDLIPYKNYFDLVAER